MLTTKSAFIISKKIKINGIVKANPNSLKNNGKYAHF